ncbi:hypothetical protein A7D23_12025 [Dehalobacter sp. TeCB1]|uniref:Uncharacterized protein n=1 Tax=Dehalobacter restrictus (strain DSM 9455 / PER-K23) TaxID=871738 RepID=A0ABN4BVF9_DEHRP|nr:hypothetical protein DEHRE_08485 [Dehalobacter restrictus DSM 9455]OCZ52017.1 hypothetical protein A7D23_12025 [Dehalobacter sp. TeCB1]
MNNPKISLWDTVPLRAEQDSVARLFDGHGWPNVGDAMDGKEATRHGGRNLPKSGIVAHRLALHMVLYKDRNEKY